MIDKNDWRLQGQEKYLKGVTLYLKKYIKYRNAWDHDHCEFCWAKFSLEGSPDDLDEGYLTLALPLILLLAYSISRRKLFKDAR